MEERTLYAFGEKVAFVSSVSIEMCVFCDGLAQDLRHFGVRDMI